MNKALFLDRDGVINERIPGAYVRMPAEFRLIDEILPLLGTAHSLGYTLVIISNQQGVGKGLMTMAELDEVHVHMQQCLRLAGAPTMDAVYVCTDLDGAQSTHRKPAPGMLLDALRDHNIDASMSWFVGDSLTDAQAGRAAGVRTALVGDFNVGDADVVASSHVTLLQAMQKLL